MERVLITAGGSGIGLAMAKGFDVAGYEVCVTDVDQAALNAAPSHWRKDCVDASNEAHMSALISDLGALDVVCANAGIAGPTAKLEDIELSDWRACQAVNLEGAFLAVKHAAPAMKAARRGAFIFTSSTAGQNGFPNRAPYAAAKWAVLGLMKTAAMELGPFGIRCNAICPGSVEGPRIEGVLEHEAAAKGMTRDQVYAGYAAGTSLGAFVEATDVADMAVFLASDAARMVSGQVIAVDGHTVNPDPQI